jgi:hypothetical protein
MAVFGMGGCVILTVGRLRVAWHGEENQKSGSEAGAIERVA